MNEMGSKKALKNLMVASFKPSRRLLETSDGQI